MVQVGCGSVGLIFPWATTTAATSAARPSADSIFRIVAPTRNSVVFAFCMLNVALRSLLPVVPRPQDLSRDLRLVSRRNRLELLHATHEAVGKIQIAQLIGRHPMGATQSSGLPAGRAPTVKKVPLLIELENPARARFSNPDGAVLIDEVVDGQRFLTGWPVRRTDRPHVEELAVLVEHLHPLVADTAIDDEHLPIGADRDAVH